MNKSYEQTSKFLSYILRHKPEAIGLTLDIDGWADINELLDKAQNYGEKVDKNLIHKIVLENDKKRFAISNDGTKIRAEQGHSTRQVNIGYNEKKPPKNLYHGTASRFLDSIFKQGLKSGNRHYVHLSDSVDIALEVGKRYGKVVVLKIKSDDMYKKGFKFYLTDNNVWLSKNIPCEFICELTVL